MLLIPAIDLKDGRCVRLRQGDMRDVTVFSEDPAEMAAKWVEMGAERLHVVDLNGARSGKPVNETAIRKIIQAVGPDVAVQLGGGDELTEEEHLTRLVAADEQGEMAAGPEEPDVDLRRPEGG